MKSKKTKKVILLLILFLNINYLRSEESLAIKGQKETISIVGLSQGVDSFEVPYSTETLTKLELSKKMPRSMTEALDNSPGVMVQKTANGHGSPFIRGFTGYRTLALIDGIRYNNSVYRDGPNEYFSLIDIQSIDQIELLLGPSSVLYGSDAIGGAVNVRTKTSNFLHETEGAFFQHGLQHYRFSSAENSHVSRTEYEFGYGQEWAMNLGYTYKNFGDVSSAGIGTQKNTGYNEYAWDMKFEYKIDPNWQLTLAYQNLEQDDVHRTHSTIHARSYAGTTVGTDLRRLKDQQRSLSYFKLSGDNLDSFYDRLTLTLSLQNWNEEGDRIKGNNERIKDGFDSRMYGLDLKLESDTSIGTLVYGFDAYRDEVDSERDEFNADGSFNRRRIQGPVGDESIYDIFGTYVQLSTDLTERLHLVTGARFSYTRASIGKFEDPVTNQADNFSDSWNSGVASVRLSYDLTEDKEWLLWGGLSQSFRAPNIADLSRFGKSRSTETEVAATDLDPEKFLTYEAGLKGRLQNVDFTATYYYTQIKDFVTSTPTGNIVGGLTEVSKQNSAEGYVQGVELAATVYLDENWELFGNVTWMQGELEADSSIGGNNIGEDPISRIMPLSTNFGLRWTRADEKLWFELACTLTDDADVLSDGDKGDTERISPGGTPGYHLIGLRGGYEINKNVSLNIGLENLLNDDYRVHGSGVNGPGFGINVGVTVKF